jgi:hypothetical protein
VSEHGRKVQLPEVDYCMYGNKAFFRGISKYDSAAYLIDEANNPKKSAVVVDPQAHSFAISSRPPDSFADYRTKRQSMPCLLCPKSEDIGQRGKAQETQDRSRKLALHPNKESIAAKGYGPKYQISVSVTVFDKAKMQYYHHRSKNDRTQCTRGIFS